MTSNRLTTIPPDPLFLPPACWSRPRPPRFRPWCWPSGGNPCTATASWCGCGWRGRTTWRPALLPRRPWASPLLGSGRGGLVCEPCRPTAAAPCRAQAGRPAALRCRAVGTLSPACGGCRLPGPAAGQPSRARAFPNGTLELLVTEPGDGGIFTCIAANAAGAGHVAVELTVVPTPPQLANSTSCDPRGTEPDASLRPLPLLPLPLPRRLRPGPLPTVVSR